MRVPEKLVERAVRTGEREALAALVAAVQDDIFRLLLSRLGDTTEAEDATQETFRQVLESLRTLREPGTFAGWIYRIALDKARQARRARAAEQRTLSALAARTSASGEDAMHPAEQAEIREKVREAVKGLDDDLRMAVELRYEHDLSYAEIAEATEVPEGTVARRLHTAHDRLQKALAGAGVAIAFAAIERELSAAPRSEVPRHVARWLERMARDGGSRAAIPRVSGGRFRAMASALALFLGVSAIVLWRLNRDGGQGNSTANAPERSRVPAGGSEGRRDARLPAEDPASAPIAARPPESKVLLTGRVRDRLTGASISGANVEALLFKDGSVKPERSSVQADDAGRFRLEVSPGDYLLSAGAPGYLDLLIEAGIGTPEGRPGILVPAAGLTERGIPVRVAAGASGEIELSLYPGAVLEGIVTDPAGKPVDGATIRLFGQEIMIDDQNFALLPYEGHGPNESDTTDAAGAFRIGGLWPAGCASFTVSADGYLEERVRLEVAVPSTRAPVVLRRAGRLAGTILDEAGRPVPGALVFAESEEEGTLQPGVPAGSEGAFDLRSVPPGARRVMAWAPGHGSAAALSPGEGGAVALVLPAATATLRGSVVDPAGAPVAGAEVVVVRVTAEVAGLKASLAFEGLDAVEGEWIAWASDGILAPAAKTDAAGRFELAGVAVGSGSSVTLAIRRGGFREATRTVAAPEWVGITLTPLPAGK